MGASKFEEQPEELGLNNEAKVERPHVALCRHFALLAIAAPLGVAARICDRLFFHSVNKAGDTLDRSRATGYGGSGRHLRRRPSGDRVRRRRGGRTVMGARFAL